MKILPPVRYKWIIINIALILVFFFAIFAFILRYFQLRKMVTGYSILRVFH